MECLDSAHTHRRSFHVWFRATSFRLRFYLPLMSNYVSQNKWIVYFLLVKMLPTCCRWDVWTQWGGGSDWLENDRRLVGVCESDGVFPPAATLLHISHLPACFCVTLLKLRYQISQEKKFWWIDFLFFFHCFASSFSQFSTNLVKTKLSCELLSRNLPFQSLALVISLNYSSEF